MYKLLLLLSLLVACSRQKTAPFDPFAYDPKAYEPVKLNYLRTGKVDITLLFIHG